MFSYFLGASSAPWPFSQIKPLSFDGLSLSLSKQYLNEFKGAALPSGN